MHELSIAQSILDIVVEEMRTHQVERLVSIRLAIGELTAVVPESLHFCWSLVADGTPAQGSRLEMEIFPVRAGCRACGFEFMVRDHQYVCPKCGSIELDMLSGRELHIQDMEVETNPTVSAGV